MTGPQIRAARLRLGLTQTELGERLCLTLRQVQRLEAGTNRVTPRVERDVRALLEQAGLDLPAAS